MNFIDKNIVSKLAKRGDEIIRNTEILYSWEEIIKGATVKRGNGELFTERAVDRKTWRVFRRKDKNVRGVSSVFDTYFLEQKENII